MNIQSVNKVKEIIKKNKTFLITSHINLEGDSIASQLAVYRLLKALGKTAYILDEDKPAPLYRFLPYIELIKNNIRSVPFYECAIIIDCPVVERAGNVAKILKDTTNTIVNIDHHVSNVFFGDVNWVEGSASSCGEMVYELFQSFGKPIDKKTALLLYTAILTDSGSFGYENTSAKTHAIVKELIEKGIRPIDVHNKIYENRSIQELELLKKALSTLKVVHNGSLAYLYVTRKMLKASGCRPNVTEGFINYARSIKGVKLALVFLESEDEPGVIQISFRSKGEFNVNVLASHFNGGGHNNAAGCIKKGRLEKVITEVLKTAKKYL